MAENSDNIQEPSPLLENLTILSTIENGDKISWYEDKFFVYKWDYYQGLRRWWNSETRNNSITKLEEFIEDVFKTIDSVISSEIPNSNPNSYYIRNKNNKKSYTLKEETKELIKTLIEGLLKSQGGIQNLKHTYDSDLPICSTLDIIIEKINVRTKKIEETYLKTSN
jgi:hypothetical protein